MARQSLIWTALPNGYSQDGRQLRLSVLLSPRLDPQGDEPRLKSFFPDWEDWPTALRKSRFHVTLGATTVTIAGSEFAGPERIDDSLGLADSVAWQAVFGPDLFVKGFKFEDLSNHGVLSYDTVAMAGMTRDLYGDLARKADGDLPSMSDIADHPDWRDLVTRIQTLDFQFWNDSSGLRDPAWAFERYRRNGHLLGHPKDRSEMLARFQLFHTPPATPMPRKATRTDDDRIDAKWLEYERAAIPKPEEIAEQLDFHRIVAAMNAYPTVLRRLGLVVDILVRRDAFPPSANAPLSVQVVFDGGVLQVPLAGTAAPQTQTLLSDKKFQPVSNPAASYRVKDGLLDLDPTKFDLLQVDVDGAGLKVMNFARSLGRRINTGDAAAEAESRVDPISRIEDQVGAPALRNAGLMLVHRDRGDELKARLGGNQLRNQAIEDQFQGIASVLTLYAEDIVRGYRIDVWDSTTGAWRSICRRQATYELGEQAVAITPKQGEEETIIRLAAGKAANEGGAADKLIYLHEALVSWTGWSLAAPPPGRVIDKNDGFDTTTTQSEAEMPPGLHFRSRFKAVPGSLPRLRFGRSYWMRARAVDLAGNSLEPLPEDLAAEQPKLNARPFLRFDPVEPPALALLREGGTISVPREGESMGLLAIRSYNDVPADNLVATAETATRIAVPPRTNVRVAEQHGKLDAGGGVDSTLFDLLANQKDFDGRDPGAAVQEVLLPMQGPLGGATADTYFAVYEAGQSLTYLPDPLAEEIAVRFFDHPNVADSEILTIPLYPAGKWPEALPFSIEIYDDASAKPDFDPVKRCLRVPLPKAARIKIRLSMKLSKQAWQVMGIAQWMNAADQAAQESRALSGQHWMFTPWRVLEAVHAVQRPLITPEISQLTIARRDMSATSARPVFLASCSIDSTDRIDVRAEWHEPVDDPGAVDSAEAQIDRRRNDLAFSAKITDPKRYRLLFDGHKAGGFADHTIHDPDQIGINAFALFPGFDRGLMFPPKAHEFHDTRYRRIEYWLDATTRFREFLPTALIADDGGQPTEVNIKVTGPRAVTWIPSSAPPPIPNILYVVPTYGWTRNTDAANNQSSWRRGGGLRVYLDRQWNVSGYGEMLAVVLPPAGFTGDPDHEPDGHPFKKYVTQWGNDPVWESPFVSGIAPKRANFPLARTAPDPQGAWLPQGAPATEADQKPGPFAVTSLQPPEVLGSNASVEVAPHDVFYDSVRRLWYCDIEIEAGASYSPFVRLALARYQPTAEPNAYLSNVVPADIMALAMDRWLTVTAADQQGLRHVTVYGVTYRDSSGHDEAAHSPAMSLKDPLNGTVETLEPAKVAESSVVDVWVERLDETRGEDFGWQRVAATITPAGQDTGNPFGGLVVKRAPIHYAAATEVDRPAVLKARAFVAKRDFNALAREGLIDHVRLFQPLWEGKVVLSADSPVEARHRLVIAEYEEYLIDDSRPYDKVPTKKGRRLVFVEHVELI